MNSLSDEKQKNLEEMTRKYGDTSITGEPMLIFSSRQIANESFDAGVLAERERILNAISERRREREEWGTRTISWSDLRELFPQEQEK